MTISYTHLSHTAGLIGGLSRLLFIWKGSLFKQIWPDFLLFFGLYGCLSLLYRIVLIEYEDQKLQYELFCVYCDKFCKVIPISFLLGFYVTQVVSRWWAQFMSLPWPDTLARYLAVYLPGTDSTSRNYRRTICRWVNLGNVMALRLVSYKVMVRFPSYEHLVESGLATNREMIVLKQLDELVKNRHQISWFPNMWAQNLIRKARKEGLIANDWFSHVLIKEVDNMANMNGMLICYGWINIPLVYTQVVTLAVYAYFAALLFGRQYLLPTQYKVEDRRYVPVADFPKLSNWSGTLVPGANNIIGYDNDVCDFFIPIFTAMEFLFYMGWLKVAETLLNPFGEDDDDFDTYYLIERNLQIAYIMSDEAGQRIDPELDPFNEYNAPELKHTALSANYLDDDRPMMPTDNLHLTQEQTNIASSVKGSHVNLAGHMGSKLNLAGNYLAIPVTELAGLGNFARNSNASDASGTHEEGSDVRSYNMATHLLGTGDTHIGSRRPSRQAYMSGIPEEDTTECAASHSPFTSRNESMLFAVPKDIHGAPPRIISSGIISENNGETDGGNQTDGDSDVFSGDNW